MSEKVQERRRSSLSTWILIALGAGIGSGIFFGERTAFLKPLADAFIRHWDAYRAVLLVRNLAADEGERRFQKLRREALRPVLDALAEKIEECQTSATHAGDVHAYAAAAALVSILERLAACHKELEPLGVTRDDLVETCARIMYQTVTGRLAPSSA